MNYWRMSFRLGVNGPSVWEECRSRGIAAMGYFTPNGDRIIGDCSKITEDEFNHILKSKDPKSTSSRASLRNLAYRIRIGDIIYAKEGPQIVGRGTVISEYCHDLRILSDTDAKWEHFVHVHWDVGFIPMNISLGAELHTLLRLTGARLDKLHRAMARYNPHIREAEDAALKDIDSANMEEHYFLEGGKRRKLIFNYERNPGLRAAAILHHGTKCCICGFRFVDLYGEHGRGFIEVHHLYPVSKRKHKHRVDPRTDMAVVCSNCHSMIHRNKESPLSISQMKRIIRSRCV